MINGMQNRALIIDAINALTPLLKNALLRVLNQANPELFDDLIGYQAPLEPIDDNELNAIFNDENIEALNNLTANQLIGIQHIGEIFKLDLIAFAAPENVDGAEDRPFLDASEEEPEDRNEDEPEDRSEDFHRNRRRFG